MTTILAAIFVFGVLITVHEFGHFITAKMTGMRVYGCPRQRKKRTAPPETEQVWIRKSLTAMILLSQNLFLPECWLF